MRKKKNKEIKTAAPIEKPKLIGEATPEVIAVWKRKHKSVYAYQTRDGRICYLSNASMKVIDACRTLSGGNAYAFNRELLTNCWLGGDNEIRTNEDYLLGLYDWIAIIIRKVEGQLVEL